VAEVRAEASPRGREPSEGGEGSLGQGEPFSEMCWRGKGGGEPVAQPSDIRSRMKKLSI
jgi:hypothetical protein